MSEFTESGTPANRAMVLVSMMLAVIMTVLDQTIANVALPHMAGAVQASPDQITWVLTSYIISAAIMTPTSGWLSGRFGRKQVFLVSIVGFTVTSAMCGAAQSLGQIVLFRILQGAFGAAMTPLSQAVVLDTYPVEQRGSVMAIWSIGVMVAPIMGPVLGGWLTDDFNWRWVFYINIPVGVLSFLGVSAFLNDPARQDRRPFDVTGFALLSLALAAFQLCIDRGQNNDWFHSPETVIEACVAAVAVLLFAVHILSVDHPFLPLVLLKDRNFVTGTLLIMLVGMLVTSVLALLPPLTQTLLGYPVTTAGMMQAPRGLGNLTSMVFIGRLIGRVDTRVLIAIGLSMFAIAFFGMSHFDLQMDAFSICWTGFIQGFGNSFLFLPIIALAFDSLPPALRADGTGVFTLMRNLGNAAGISMMEAIFTRNAQVVHARLTETLTPDNPAARPMLGSPANIALLNGEVTRQASMVSYIDVFHVMFLITIGLIPLVLLLRETSGRRVEPEAAPIE